jgi:hypothetical protein
MTGTAAHKFAGIAHVPAKYGSYSNCACGWTGSKHSTEITADVLSEYTNHVTEKLQQQIDALIAAVGPKFVAKFALDPSPVDSGNTE